MWSDVVPEQAMLGLRVESLVSTSTLVLRFFNVFATIWFVVPVSKEGS